MRTPGYNFFFTGDTHFGHGKMAQVRGFKSTDEMDDALIGAWNKVVRPSSTVYHLGDFGFHQLDRIAFIMRYLNGRICLIPGNHDKHFIKGRGALLFPWQKELVYTKIDGQKIMMCHYPMASWRSSHHGSWMLHGHCHGNLEGYVPYRLDVGVDNNLDIKWAPWSFEQIKELLKDDKFVKVDHHE